MQRTLRPMPGPKDKKRASALKKVWEQLRAYIATELAKLPPPAELWKRIEAKKMDTH
jgi:ribosomal 50S subunit-associated protein YjgA (DUF615 family)